MKLTISKATIYDSDNELWETKVGLDNKVKDLKYSCWAKSKEDSIKLASELISIFNNKTENQ